MTSWRALLLTAVLAAMGTGCAHTIQRVPLPDQSRLLSDPNHARIYIMRPTMEGGPLRMQLWDGPTWIGSIGQYGYVCWERSPGQAVLRSLAPGNNSTTLPLECAKGGTYYVEQAFILRGGLQGTVLRMRPESEGKRLLAECSAPDVRPAPEGR